MRRGAKGTVLQKPDHEEVARFVVVDVPNLPIASCAASFIFVLLLVQPLRGKLIISIDFHSHMLGTLDG